MNNNALIAQSSIINDAIPAYDIASEAKAHYESQYVQDFSDTDISTPLTPVKRFVDQVAGVNPVFNGSSPAIDSGFDDGSGNNCAATIEMPGFDMLGILFVNSRDNKYTTPPFTAIVGAFTAVYVFYKLDGLDGENTDKGANAPNLRDKSDSANIRIGRNVSELVQLTVADGFLPNALNIVQVEYNDNESKVFFNRVQVGGNVDLDEAITITNYIFGSQTNCTTHVKFMTTYYEGIPSTTILDKLYGEYTRRGYVHGKVVEAPFASNITFDQSTVGTNAIMKVNWTQQKNAGANVVSTKVRWYYSLNGSAPDLSVQNLLVEQNLGDVTQASINLNDYEALDITPSSPFFPNSSGIWIYAKISHGDTNGKTFVETGATDWKRDNIPRYRPTVSFDFAFRQDARATPTALAPATHINDISISSNEVITNPVDILGNVWVGLSFDASSANLFGQSDSGGTSGDTTNFTATTVNTFIYADRDVGVAPLFFDGLDALGLSVKEIKGIGSTAVGGSTNRDTEFHAGGNDGLEQSVVYDALLNSTEFTISNPSLDLDGNLRMVLEGIGIAASNSRGLISVVRITCYL